MSRLFRHIARRPDRPVIFALWGSWAKGFEDEIRSYAEQAGTSDQVALAKAQHPVTKSFLTNTNPLTVVNDRLVDMGETRTNWLPL